MKKNSQLVVGSWQLSVFWCVLRARVDFEWHPDQNWAVSEANILLLKTEN